MASLVSRSALRCLGDAGSCPGSFAGKSLPRRTLPAALGLSPTKRQQAAVRAVAHSGRQQEAVLSGVDELPDGSVVLHFVPEDSSDGDTPEVEQQLVSFLTRDGGQHRDVPTEVLEQVMGSHYHGHHGHQAHGSKSFAGGPTAPAHQEPVHKQTAHARVQLVSSAAAAPVPYPAEPKVTPRHVAAAPAVPAPQESKPNRDPVRAVAAVAAAGAPAVPKAVAAQQVQPTKAKTQPNQTSPAPSTVKTPRSSAAASGGLDTVRVLAVAIAAAMASAIIRALAVINGISSTLPWSHAFSNVGTLATFAATFVFFWATGFARSSLEQATA